MSGYRQLEPSGSAADHRRWKTDSASGPRRTETVSYSMAIRQRHSEPDSRMSDHRRLMSGGNASEPRRLEASVSKAHPRRPEPIGNGGGTVQERPIRKQDG